MNRGFLICWSFVCGGEVLTSGVPFLLARKVAVLSKQDRGETGVIDT
jgi:hypothetical protein